MRSHERERPSFIRQRNPQNPAQQPLIAERALSTMIASTMGWLPVTHPLGQVPPDWKVPSDVSALGARLRRIISFCARYQRHADIKGCGRGAFLHHGRCAHVRVGRRLWLCGSFWCACWAWLGAFRRSADTVCWAAASEKVAGVNFLPMKWPNMLSSLTRVFKVVGNMCDLRKLLS